ncbi:MAG: Anti-sigma-28 factor, FlgM [Thermotogae bacterium ADurb.Bin062]|jgi:anti-sigma28 factor (negative regulator of flagellin synthesis)|nr:MAG: Anti-sigma-28 factor, FlgM [Thermotogota bacterium ADurb.Bin062]
MVMIDPKDILRIGDAQKVYPTARKRVRSESEPVRGEEESLFSSERLTISGTSNLSEILKKAELLPEVREELVSKFQKLIESGAYKPDPDRIARKILEG